MAISLGKRTIGIAMLRTTFGLLAIGFLGFSRTASAAPEDSDDLESILSDDSLEPEEESSEAPLESDAAPEAQASASATTGTTGSTAGAGSSGGPWSLQGGIGPAVNLEFGSAYGKLPLDFQYHFQGGDTGPALGALVSLNFATRTFGMDIGPIFLWDFKVLDKGNFKMYAAPLVALGYTFTTVSLPDPFPNVTAHAFFMDFGGQIKGLFNDRIGFYARPLNFSLIAGQGGATGSYAFLAGVSVRL